MNKTLWLWPPLLVAAFAGAFYYRTHPKAHAAPAKIVIDGRVVDESDTGIRGVKVTVWPGARGAPSVGTTKADGSYSFDIDACGPINVSYHHSAHGSAVVRQLSGLLSHRISPVMSPGDGAKISALAAHAELQSIERLVFLATMSPGDTPPEVREFLKSPQVVKRVRALGNADLQGPVPCSRCRRKPCTSEKAAGCRSRSRGSVERSMTFLFRSARSAEYVLDAYQSSP